jgi:hypothetical protein
MIWELRWHPLRPLNDEELGIGSFASISEFIRPGNYMPPTNEPGGRFRLVANRSNDYLLDHDAQRTARFSGLPNVPVQDQAMTESMGSIVDRRRERLGTTDAGIIRVRRRLLEAVRALHGHQISPPGVNSPDVYRVRSASGLLPKDAEWFKATRSWIASLPGAPVTSA